MTPDVETPLLGGTQTRNPEPSSSPAPSALRKYLALAVVLATSVVGIIVLQNAVSTSNGVATTSLKELTGAAFFTYHTATAADSDYAAENMEHADMLAAKVAAMNANVHVMSANPDAVSAKTRIMSLVGASSESAFNMCSSEFEAGKYGVVDVKPGCISLFNNDVSNQVMSRVITFCGCESIGPKKYDLVSLQKASLVSKNNAGMISYIATGDGASVTIYNGPNFDSDYKDVIGPNSRVQLSRLVMGESTWDNSIYSIIMQSWTDCNLPAIKCDSVTTQVPVTEPTPSPFIKPTAPPSSHPAINPTHMPSFLPTANPTKRPRARPTMEPLAVPTLSPTFDPTKSPLAVPSRKPTKSPVAEPSQHPTEPPVNLDPTLQPTEGPTMDPRIVICKGKPVKESNIQIGVKYPNPGCASFFWKDVDEVDSSYISTICTCSEVGAFDVPNNLMAKVGATRPDGFPTISSIVTGYNTSLTMYASKDMTGYDKYVVGPQEVADLTKIKRKSGAGSWDDVVSSLSLMSWNQCSQHLYKNSCFDF